MHKKIKSKTKKKMEKPRRIINHFIYNKPKFPLKEVKVKINIFKSIQKYIN